MPYALSLRDLKKTYKNGYVALKGINLDVGEGDFFGLLGPNGAGKSTTIGIITSLVNKTGGRAHGLQRGANVVMPNLTPAEERERYEIYPEKAAVHETAEAINVSIMRLLSSLGRTPGAGAGGRRD